MGQSFCSPAEESVEGAGLGPDVIAGDHPGTQQLGQGVHQFEAYAVVALFGNPDRDPNIGNRGLVGGNIPGYAESFLALLSNGKMKFAGRYVVVIKQLRTVDKGKLPIKMLVYKFLDLDFLTGVSQTKLNFTQWRCLLSQVM